MIMILSNIAFHKRKLYTHVLCNLKRIKQVRHMTHKSGIRGHIYSAGQHAPECMRVSDPWSQPSLALISAGQIIHSVERISSRSPQPISVRQHKAYK